MQAPARTLTDGPVALPRRTQQQRREKTRSALMEATVACLVELGYSATTTLEVERRAGASRGARIHYFPTKALLLASAVDYLYGRLGDHYEQAFGHARAGAGDAERFGSGLQLLWSVYQQPGYAGVLELSMAARTDDELRARLEEVVERHRTFAIQAAAKYFPAIETALAEPLVDTIHATLTGLLMQRNIGVDHAREQGVLRMLEALAAPHLSDATPAPHSPTDVAPEARRQTC